MKNDNGNAIVHGAGAALLALLGMLGRFADDAARIGAGSVDDVGRACMNSTDDLSGSLMTRSGDELLRPLNDFRVVNYVDELRFNASTPRTLANEGDETVSITTHVAEKVTEATFRLIDLPDDGREN